MRVAARTLLIACLIQSQAVLAEQPKTGDIYDIDEGEQFRSSILRHSDAGGSSPVWRQAFSLFENSDGSFLISVIETIGPYERGVKPVNRIIYSMTVKPDSNETVLDGFDCGFLNEKPVVTFFNPSSKVATGYFATSNDTIWKRRWLVDDVSECQHSVD